MSSRRCCPRRPRRRCSGALSAPRVLLVFFVCKYCSRPQVPPAAALRFRRALSALRDLASWIAPSLPDRSSCPCAGLDLLRTRLGSLRTPLANSGGSYPPIHAGCTWFFSGGLSTASPVSCVQRGVQADGGGGRGPATGWWLASRGTDGEEDARFFVPPPFGSP